MKKFGFRLVLTVGGLVTLLFLQAFNLSLVYGHEPVNPAQVPVPPRDPLPAPPRDPVSPGTSPTASPGSSVSGPDRRSGDPALAIKKVMPAKPRVGDIIDLTLSVTNTGGRADAVEVFSFLPSFLELLNVTSSWGSSEKAGNIAIVDIGPLFDKDVVEIHVLARVSRTAQPAENLYKASLFSKSSGDHLGNNNSSLWLEVLPEILPTPE